MNTAFLKPLRKPVLALLYPSIPSCLKGAIWDSAEWMILNSKRYLLPQKLPTGRLLQNHHIPASQSTELYSGVHLSLSILLLDFQKENGVPLHLLLLSKCKMIKCHSHSPERERMELCGRTLLTLTWTSIAKKAPRSWCCVCWLTTF